MQGSRSPWCLMMWKTILINPLNPIVHFWLHHIAHCTEKMSQHACAQVLVEQKGWDREVGGSPTLWHAHCVCCGRTMVRTGLATPLPDCMDRLRNRHSHFAGVWFLARKAAWALSGCITTESADPECETCLALGSWLHQSKLSPQA